MSDNICDKCKEETGQDTRKPVFCNYCFKQIGCWDHVSHSINDHEWNCDQRKEAKSKDPLGRLIEFIDMLRINGQISPDEFDDITSKIADTFKDR